MPRHVPWICGEVWGGLAQHHTQCLHAQACAMDLKKGEGVTQEGEGLQGLPLPISAYLQSLLLSNLPPTPLCHSDWEVASVMLRY